MNHQPTSISKIPSVLRKMISEGCAQESQPLSLERFDKPQTPNRYASNQAKNRHAIAKSKRVITLSPKVQVVKMRHQSSITWTWTSSRSFEASLLDLFLRFDGSLRSSRRSDGFSIVNIISCVSGAS